LSHTVTALFDNAGHAKPAPQRAHVIAVTSGKGGVGKTSVTTNLAISLARQGRRVCIFDADTGLANINILLGLNPKHTLESFLDGSLPIEQLLLEGPRGVCIVPGASGIAEFANLDRFAQQALLNGLQKLESQFDYLLIDTAAGIADSVIQFVLAASQGILVVSPDPTSLTDAFALTRVLKRNHYKGALRVLVNMAESRESARKVFLRFSQAVEKYLQMKVEWFGHVRADRAVVSSIRLQHPVVLVQPDAPASRCFEQLATHLQQLCTGQPARGISEFLRAREPETADTSSVRTIEMIRGAAVSQPTPANPANAGEPNRQLIDSINDVSRSAEELAASIAPIIDAYVARFHAYPLDMSEAIVRQLDAGEFPEHEIRTQIFQLEQLYEKRCQHPVLDKEDSLFRLLNLLRNNEPEFARAIARLRDSYERKYRPGPQDALDTLVQRLQLPGTEEQAFADCIETVRRAYAERFGRAHRLIDPELRAQLEALVHHAEQRERERVETIAKLSHELQATTSYQEQLAQLLASLDDAQPDSP
jgi:flagellar biosynthesis protein FlhG